MQTSRGFSEIAIVRHGNANGPEYRSNLENLGVFNSRGQSDVVASL